MRSTAVGAEGGARQGSSHSQHGSNACARKRSYRTTAVATVNINIIATHAHAREATMTVAATVNINATHVHAPGQQQSEREALGTCLTLPRVQPGAAQQTFPQQILTSYIPGAL